MDAPEQLPRRSEPWWRRLWSGRDGAAAGRAAAAQRLYGTIVEQARTPVFFGRLGIPDTTEGRFEMVALHAALVMRRLKGEGADGKALSQELFDLMFEDVDENLRELGVGDLSVGKYVKRFARQFYARIEALETALGRADRQRLGDFLAANLYFGGSVPGDAARRCMVDYLFLAADALDEVRGDDLLAGRIAPENLPSPSAPAAGASHEGR
jgi:cytochrome b pre-mRNA-processing protein 3